MLSLSVLGFLPVLILAVPLNELVRNAPHGMVYDDQRTISRDISFEPKSAVRPEMILWTDGDEIYMVESTSFAHALMFEKKLPDI